MTVATFGVPWPRGFHAAFNRGFDYLRDIYQEFLAWSLAHRKLTVAVMIGFALGSVGLYPVDRSTCELRKMYLHSSFRGKGLGRLLLEHALKRAKELGFSRVTLETASVLKEAIALYQSYGFRSYAPDHLAGRCDQAHYLDLVPTSLD